MKSGKLRRLVVVAAILAAAVYAMGGGSSVGQAAIVGYVPGRVLVKFRPGTPHSDKARLHRRLQAQPLGLLPQIDVDVVGLRGPVSVEAALRTYEGDPNVEFAEPDGIAEPDAVPNDPMYSSQWHLPKIAGPAAWGTTTGSSGIIIAILDTGVDSAHLDLAAKLVPGWNAYNNNSDTRDVYGHGTSTAGVAAAIGNNGLGVASVAWGCRIMPIRISDTTGYGYYSTAASGLTWAADHGARVANISYEFTGSSTVRNAAKYFQSKGGVVTISAGNGNTALTIPDNPYVLTVGATDSADARASFSNTGNAIDLVAPGVSITTTAKGGGYRTASGTSFSAPMVAGVAALVLSVNPDLTAAQVQQIVMASTNDLGAAGYDPQFGWGRVNAANAVALASQGAPDTRPPAVAFVTPTEGASLRGTALVQVSASDDRGVAYVSVAVDSAAPTVVTAAPYEFTWDTAKVANGAHTLVATAADASGNSATARVTVTVQNSTSDTIPPAVQLIAPTNGTTVYSMLWAAARATDNVGVVLVELYLDRTLIGTSTLAAATYWVSTQTWSPGVHALEAKAYDAAGNVAWSPPVTVYK